MSIEKQSTICEEIVFSNFYKKHATALRNFLYYKYGNADQANDMAQESFVKLWQNCKSVPLEKAKSFLYTVAKNLSLNVLKHEKVVLNYQKTSTQTEVDNQNPEFLLEEEQFKKKLLKAIENLNETHRTAFLMNRIDGKKYVEIAQELNISVKAVEKRISNALVQLRKEIENFK
jgi:RNA polymerase sigma-70 factor (family 1)